MDGRTTIFDYWGVKSLQAWTNHGKFDGKQLSDEQKKLRKFYQSLLTIARDNKAVTDGLMYDLEYAQGEGFDKHEQFAFLRKAEDELLMVVVNFDDKQCDIRVNIPEDAFHYLQQAPLEKATATELITDEVLTSRNEKGRKQKTIAFIPNSPIAVTLPAWTGAVYRIIDANKKKRK
jgi:hypothetical protein